MARKFKLIKQRTPLRRVQNSQEALKEIKKGNDVHLDERRADYFELSKGNLKVLETIPIMMNDPFWRKQLRALVLNYLYGEHE